MSIDVVVADHIATVTINRPDRLNAMDTEHYQALSEAWIRIRDDADIRVAVITGAGEKSFSAGADIKTRLTRHSEWSETWLTQREQLLNRGLEVWKPVIAAVNGLCIGGGVTLLLATDIRYAAEHATFGLSEVKRGTIAGNGGTQRVMQNLPRAIAMEMLLTGDAMDARTAAHWGLVNRVVPSADLMRTAMETARKIAANAPLAVQASKELALRSRDVDTATGLRIEQLMGRLLRETEDGKEGPRAFAEKRPPRFEGR
jgi:enoyl-CoA hydratase/carnithine racemase